MLINKWLVIDSFNNTTPKDWRDGFCLELLSHQPGDMSDLYKDLQRLPLGNPFAILLSEKSSLAQNTNDPYIESIISLFLQPSYFLDSDVPVIFLSNKTTDHAWFIERLSEKCMKQGLPVLIFKTKSAGRVENSGSQVYEVTTSDIDYNALVENWLSEHLEGKDPDEIHFLFKENAPGLTEMLREMEKKEILLHNTKHYKFAKLAYEKQKLIEKYKTELDEKVYVEKNTQLYLRMQKKQTADNVEWYHHEYEILPTWYKRLGHIVKVLMGRRTFRSLFSDKAKKYKD